MLRSRLLNNGYHFEMKEPKKAVINFIWAVFTVLFVIPAGMIYMMMLNGDIEDIMIISLPYIDFDIAIINIMFIAIPFIYFLLREFLTALFRSDAGDYTGNKISPNATNKEMPIISHREAFRPWQIIVIYLTPLLFIYPLLFIVNIISGGNINLLILTLIMSFLMAFDLALVIYVLFLKIRYTSEYIAVNNHIYSLTLYSEKYIERKVYNNPVKTIKKKLSELTDRLPYLSAKKICVLLIAIGVLAGSVYYFMSRREIMSDIDLNLNPDDFNTYIEYCDAMSPAIKDINSFAEYEDCEILAGRNIIYCNYNGSVIYYDGKKNSVMRLDSYDNAERLCIYEECRNNPGEYCGHMPNFVADGCYSDGVLYGVRQYLSTDKKGAKNLKNYIIRYDIDANTMDKLIEFKPVAEDSFANKNFGILYSEDMLNKEYILRLSCFDENYFYGSNPDEVVFVLPTKPPVSGAIYRCNSEMKNFSAVIDLGYNICVDKNTGLTTGYTSNSARQVGVYNNYIYYILDNTSQICRYNMKLKKTDEFIGGVSEFYIDGEYLYYTQNNYVTYGDENNHLYSVKSIYRVKIDGDYTDIENKVTYVDFSHPVLVYQPKHEYFLLDWGVKDDYIYTVLSVYSDDYDDFNDLRQTLTRTKINSNAEPYIFW